MTLLRDVILAIPRMPHGHVDRDLAERLLHALNRPLTTLEGLQEINGLVARAAELAKSHGPSGGTFPTGSGAPTKIAA